MCEQSTGLGCLLASIDLTTAIGLAQIAGLFFAGCALIIQMRALANQQRTSEADQRYRRSEACLNDTEKAFRQAVATLDKSGEGPLDRLDWIAAARCISIAETMACKVELDHHIEILEAHRLWLREKLAQHLTHGRIHKRRAYEFYGVNCRSGQLEDAAQLSKQGIFTPNIPERVLYAIWKAADYPADYEDSLPKATFSDDDLERMRFSFEAARAYIEHLRKSRRGKQEKAPSP